MSSGHQIPHKGDIVVNPKTSRPIKVGGSVWRKPVIEGLISGHYQDPNVLSEYSTENDWKTKKKYLSNNYQMSLFQVEGKVSTRVRL